MDVTLTVETGRTTGSRPSKRLRAEGKIPAVVYGLGAEARSVEVAWPELRRALKTDAGTNVLLQLTVEGQTHLAVVRELQRHPVRRDVTHVDFVLVDPDAALTLDVPLVLVGTATAVEQEKGMVDQFMYTLTVDAKPNAIPNELEVDISELEINGQVRVGDLQLPDGVTTQVDPETPIAQGTVTRAAVAEEEGEGEAGEGGEAGDGGAAGDDSAGGDAD
jgi:large subunit ribosomal protein L25